MTPSTWPFMAPQFNAAVSAAERYNRAAETMLELIADMDRVPPTMRSSIHHTTRSELCRLAGKFQDAADRLDPATEE